ncbi:MAG: hypothetical protein ACRDL8_04765, partial [Solirubrobacteraceae bacterium]
MTVEPALRFFVDLVEAEGGAVQHLADSVLVLLDGDLQHRLGLPEELLVSGDPEVVSEEGGLLAVPGQPVIVDAAEMVLRRGDAGWRHVEWPATADPSREVLQQAARDQVVVDHGRLDLEGQPAARYLPVLQVAALLEHRVLLDERSDERASVHVDACTSSVLAPRLADELGRLSSRPGRGTGHARAEPDLLPALVAAHAALDARAAERQAALVREARVALRSELDRVDAYYHATLASIDTRRAGAADEKTRLYDAQEQATRAEWARRRQETEEKFSGSREVLPFRLHVLEVPGLQVPVTVRRGARAYGLQLDWVLPLGCFLPRPCPSCGALQPLVAGRDRLGCQACLPRLVSAVPAPAPRSDKVATGSPHDPVPAEEAAPADNPVPADEAAPADDGTKAPTGAAADRKRPGATDPVRAAKRIEKVWRDVVSGFWRSVWLDERFRSVAPRSPLDALYRCYGAVGPLYAVGLQPDAHFSGVHAFDPGDVDNHDIVSTSGTLGTRGGSV